MKKNPPTMREVNAAKEMLRAVIQGRSLEGLAKEPTWEEEKVWCLKNPSPRESHRYLVDARRKVLEAEASDIILAGQMGQVTSDEFYAAVKAFKDGITV